MKSQGQIGTINDIVLRSRSTLKQWKLNIQGVAFVLALSKFWGRP